MLVNNLPIYSNPSNISYGDKINNINLRNILDSYWDFHSWSIQNYTKFIEELWHFFDIIASKPYKEVNIFFRMFISEVIFWDVLLLLNF